jgi:hypothetical protein
MITVEPEIAIELLALAEFRVKTGAYGTVAEFVEKLQLIYSKLESAVSKIIAL